MKKIILAPVEIDYVGPLCQKMECDSDGSILSFISCPHIDVQRSVRCDVFGATIATNVGDPYVRCNKCLIARVMEDDHFTMEDDQFKKALGEVMDQPKKTFQEIVKDIDGQELSSEQTLYVSKYNLQEEIKRFGVDEDLI